MLPFVLRLAFAALVSLTVSSAHAEWRRAGPVWHNSDAQGKCPQVCGREGWDGNWRTTGPGFEAVCSCGNRGGWRGGHDQRSGWDRPRHGSDRPRGNRTVQVNAGPIWHNGDAQNKCPRVCSSVGRWNGNWTTVGPGSSVCGCDVVR